MTAPVVGADRDRAGGVVDVFDGGAGAVADAEAPVVAQRHDPIAGLVRAFVDDEGGAGELPGGVAVVAGAGVEVVDVGAAAGEHDDVVAGEGGGPPVGDHACSAPRRWRSRWCDAAVFVGRRLTASSMSPSRSCARAARSQASCWRRFSVRRIGSSRSAETCGGARRRRSRGAGGDRRRGRPWRSRRRRGRGGGRGGGCRPCRLRRRRARCSRAGDRGRVGRGRRGALARVWLGIPALASSSAAARAASAAPITRWPERCQASRAASRLNVLPVPAGAMTTRRPP